MNATAAELTSTCTISIHGTAIAAKEPAFFNAVLARIAHHATEAETVSLHCLPRRADGWLEWTMRVQYSPTRGITIGAVQRKRGAEVEYHS